MGAILSPDGRYRYTLTRGVNPCSDDTVNFVMLNPSKADAQRDDPTIRHCIGIARSWGYGSLVVTNLFAFRATDPASLGKVSDPIGPENDRHLLEQARLAATVVCAWGAYHGYRWARREDLRGRDAAVVTMLRAAGIRLCALKFTAQGHPSHPLWCPAELLTILLEAT